MLLHFCRSPDIKASVSINLSFLNHWFFNPIFFYPQILIAAVCHSGVDRRRKAIVSVSEFDGMQRDATIELCIRPVFPERDQILDRPIQLHGSQLSKRKMHKAHTALLFCVSSFFSVCLWVFSVSLHFFQHFNSLFRLAYVLHRRHKSLLSITIIA